MNKIDQKFRHLFWFCVFVFVVSFAAMMLLIFADIPDKNREMASNTQGFLQGSLIMSAVGFLLTGNINSTQGSKKQTPGTTAEITASISTESQPLNNTDNG